VGVAAGSSHLELAVGANNSLSPLRPEDAESGSDILSHEEPPPPPAALATSGQQWNWGSLLRLGTVQAVKNNDNTETDQKVVLREVRNSNPDAANVAIKEDFPDGASPLPFDAVFHRAETPPLSNQTNSNPNTPIENPRLAASFESTEPNSPVPQSPEKLAITQLPSSPPAMTGGYTSPRRGKGDEEKKETENYQSGPSPVLATPTPNSQAATSVGSIIYDMSPKSPSSPVSTRSNHSSHFSASRSPSNLSNDESLYTSMTGDKARDASNLSPLSTHLFDHELDHAEDSDIPHDEARGIFVHPDFSKTKKANEAKFQYLDDSGDEAPDDEMAVPGFQYMAEQIEQSKAGKYGQSVRSKRESFKNNIRKHDPAGNVAGEAESPLTAIYNQLASMSQQKVDEKKPCFKRRSKKGERESPVEQLDNKEEESDTWSSFLNELAEAEKQFFSLSSTQNSSNLRVAESHDSEDSELARINSAF
jgi:hypothetical protein